MSRDRHTTITPAPVNRSAPATMGDVFDITDQHESECARARTEREAIERGESSDRQGVVWGRIVALEQALVELRTNMKFAAKIIVLAVTLAGAATTAGVFVAKYAIVGAITIELDKRMPFYAPPSRASLDNPDASHFAQVQQP